jgi:hypothetical protein
MSQEDNNRDFESGKNLLLLVEMTTLLYNGELFVFFHPSVGLPMLMSDFDHTVHMMTIMAP